jgi:hypothetical protein
MAYVPGEIATFLLGAQGGIEQDFARLYEATNPVLVRYLRVTADGDPADLALDAWATALARLKECPADDDAWLELVVGSARVAAGSSLRRVHPHTSNVVPLHDSPPVPAESAKSAEAAEAAAPLPDGTNRDSTDSTDRDGVDRAIEALRASPADEAEVLAMGAVANLGRDAMSRLTGHAPREVLALVQRGQDRLPMSFEELIAALRVPGRPDEVADLRLVTPLIAAALTGPAPAAAGTGWTPAVATAAAAPTESTAPVRSNVVTLTVGSARRAPSRSARVGAGAAAWVLGVGGLGAAAAMSGMLTAVIDGIVGGDGGRPPVTAQGPASPGTPSTGGGTSPGTPPGGQGVPEGPLDRGPAEPGTGGSTQPVSLPGDFNAVRVELVSYVVPDGPTPSTPTGTSTTPVPAPAPQTLVPQPGSGTGGSANTTPGKHKGHDKAKAHGKVHLHAKASGHAKAKAKAKAHPKPNVKAHVKAHVRAKADAKAHARAKAHATADTRAVGRDQA